MTNWNLDKMRQDFEANEAIRLANEAGRQTAYERDKKARDAAAIAARTKERQGQQKQGRNK